MLLLTYSINVRSCAKLPGGGIAILLALLGQGETYEPPFYACALVFQGKAATKAGGLLCALENKRISCENKSYGTRTGSPDVLTHGRLVRALCKAMLHAKD